MKILRWGAVSGILVLLFFVGVYAVDGIARGSEVWIGGILFILCWVLRSSSEKQAQLELRIQRLESELGKHQRWHGHMTEFKD